MDDHHAINHSTTTSRRQLDFEADNELGHSPSVLEEQEEQHKSNDTVDANNQGRISVHDNIPHELIPQLGMEFDSENEAFNFYNRYAKEVGFSIRRNKGHQDEAGRWLDRIFCCSCEGDRRADKRRDNVKFSRPQTRFGCLAMLKINARHSLNNKLQVEKFISEHTHGLVVTPSKRVFLRSQRRINSAQAAELQIANESGITPKLSVGFMAKKAGGYENLGFIPKDCSNYLQSKRSEIVKVGDTGGVLEYLQKKQCEDPKFSYGIQLDVDELITNIFWADGRMKSDYESFGDVVCFDTTHKKNKEGRPFALFVGVNHHNQSIVFGAALLYDETSETFAWLFDTFAKAMNGKKPKTIITDQDAAMAKALSLVWPETYHRLCLWHLSQNAAKHLSHVFEKFSGFAKDFSDCVYGHDEEASFLNAWAQMIETYGLQDNTWLDDLFEIRRKWAVVYGRQYFGANMTTTQRSESMNSQLRRYVRYDYNLLRFFEHFQRLLDDRRFAELNADFNASQSKPSKNENVEILQHAARVYTPAIYKLFYQEVSATWNWDLHKNGVDGNITSYNVILGSRHHVVLFDSSNSTCTCSCKKIEFNGYLCAHSLKVMSLHNIKGLPEQYILKRWTKDAKAKTSINFDFGEVRDLKKDMGNRYKILHAAYADLINRAFLTPRAFEIAMGARDTLVKQIEIELKRVAGKCENGTSQMNMNNLPCFETKPPEDNDTHKAKGIKKKPKKQGESSQRKKSVLEKAIKKKRHHKQQCEDQDQSSSRPKASKRIRKNKKTEEDTNENLQSEHMDASQSQKMPGSTITKRESRGLTHSRRCHV